MLDAHIWRPRLISRKNINGASVYYAQAMAVLLEKTQSFTFSSDTKVGAENVSTDGSVFQVTMDNPIMIPKSAIDCNVGVLQAEIWNNSPNISASFGNNV